jgi:AcrR family transcriptional regulator
MSSKFEPLPARRTPSQARSRFMVDAIVTATVRVFDAIGYRAASTRHVAERAGVSVGSLYQYFADKQALAQAALARELDEVMSPSVELPSAATFRQRFEARIRSVLRHRGSRLPVATTLMLEAPHMLFTAAAGHRLQRRMRRALESDLSRHAEALRRTDPMLAACVVDRLFKALLPPLSAEEMAALGVDEAAYAEEVIDVLDRYLFDDSDARTNGAEASRADNQRAPTF